MLTNSDHQAPFRVVCGLADQHPLHMAHTIPCATYTDAVDLAADLGTDDTADGPFVPCQPYKVQQAMISWAEVR